MAQRDRHPRQGRVLAPWRAPARLRRQSLPRDRRVRPRPVLAHRVAVHQRPGHRRGCLVKIRLHGTEEECREAAERLAAVLEVLAVSAPYPDRGAWVLVRVYIEARIAAPVHVTSMTELRPRGRRGALPPGGDRDE